MKYIKETIETVKLFEAIHDGDEAAFSQYYESTMPWLVPHIRRITKDMEEARNIAHDAFTKLWLQREQIDPVQSLDGFISKMATNAALNFVKKKQSHYKYHNEQLFVQSAEDYPADAPMLADEMEKRILQVIDNMPPQRRKVYELSRENNLTYNEIAEQMNISPGTVHRHIKIALQEIRSALYSLIIWMLMN